VGGGQWAVGGGQWSVEQGSWVVGRGNAENGFKLPAACPSTWTGLDRGSWGVARGAWRVRRIDDGRSETAELILDRYLVLGS